MLTIDENNKLQKKHIPSIFLDDLFLDADEVWKGETSFTLSSGFWTEHNESQVLRLEALAINSESGSRYLVVKNVEEQFDEKRKTLQAARELLLRHHEIVGQHEYIRHKLNGVLRRTPDFKSCSAHPASYSQRNRRCHFRLQRRIDIDNKASHRLLLCNSATPSSIRVNELLTILMRRQRFFPHWCREKPLAR